MPSEKAINFEELAQLVFYKCCYEHEGRVMFKTGVAAYDILKPAFDDHTAEALADYKRVLEQVEQALRGTQEPLWVLDELRDEPTSPALTAVDKALAAIAELKKDNG